MKALGDLKQYMVVGRRIPSEYLPKPPLYRMTIYAPDTVSAKSRFWYFLTRLKRVKRANGEVLSVRAISERRPTTIKNFSIFLRYDSRSGTHNMYREYRELSKAAAVTAMYRELAARHRVRARSIQVISVNEVASKDCKRVYVKQFHNSKIRFPLPHRVIKSQFRSTFVAERPNTCF